MKLSDTVKAIKSKISVSCPVCHGYGYGYCPSSIETIIKCNEGKVFLPNAIDHHLFWIQYYFEHFHFDDPGFQRHGDKIKDLDINFYNNSLNYYIKRHRTLFSG